MNEEIADTGVAALGVAGPSSHCQCDSTSETQEIFRVRADADTISDARLYLVAFGALFSGFSTKESTSGMAKS